MEGNLPRVTRALRKRLNSIDSDSSARPNTPLKELVAIAENVTPARRTRQNSKDGGNTPITLAPTTPARRITRRNSITADASPAVAASPMRRSSRILNSEDRENSNEIVNKTSKNLISTIISVIEEDESVNLNEYDDKKTNKRVTRSSSNSPKDKEQNTNIEMKSSTRGKGKRNTSQNMVPSENISECSGDLDDKPLNLLDSIDTSKTTSKSTNNSRNMSEKSIVLNRNEEVIDNEITDKNHRIDQSLEEKQRMKSVTFNDSDEDLISPKKFPKTPISSKTKSFTDSNLESSKENSENSFKSANNTGNDKDQIVLSKLIDSSSKEIQIEKSNSMLSISNLKNIDSTTPYRELKLKGSVISSSTPINVVKVNDESDLKSKKLNPIVRLTKNYNSVIDKSKESIIVPTKFSTSWGQAIHGNANEKIDKLNSEGNNTEEPIKMKESAKLRKSKTIIPSDDEDENSENDIEKFEFIDDEAEEMDGENSMDEEERQYLKDNEIPEQGEIIGSEDSTSDLEEEEDADEKDSFIVSDDSTANKLLSTDSEEEFCEINKSKNKSNYKRIHINYSDESELDEKVLDVEDVKTVVNDKAYTIEDGNSIISISTDDVFSNEKKSILNISDDESLPPNYQNISGKPLKTNSWSDKKVPKRKSMNTSSMSGIEIITSIDDSTEGTHMNSSKNNKSLNESIKSEKEQKVEKTYEEDETENKVTKSPRNKDSFISKDEVAKESADKMQYSNRKSTIQSPKLKNLSLNKSQVIAPVDSDEDGVTIKSKNISIKKSPKIPVNESEEEETIHEDLENDYTVNDQLHEKEDIVNKSLKSPKNKNTSYIEGKVLSERDNTGTETEEDEEFDKSIKNQKKSVEKSPRHNTSLINKSVNLNSMDDESYAEQNIKNKTPKKKNSSLHKKKNDIAELEEENDISFNVSTMSQKSFKNKSLMISSNTDTNVDEEIKNKSLLKSPRALNISGQTDKNISIKANQSINEQIEYTKNNEIDKEEFHFENFDNDYNEDDDKDYVPEYDLPKENDSTTSSEDVQELKAELEKINEEKNIPKSQLSFSFTSVTEYVPIEQKKNLSTSFALGEQKLLDNSLEENTEPFLENPNQNKVKSTQISETILSETEELEKLNDDVQLKQSKTKSMIENNNKKSTIPHKKSRHSLESTHLHFKEEVFEDLREKLNNSKTNNLDNMTKNSSVDSETQQKILQCYEEQSKNDTNLNKSIGNTEIGKNNVTDGSFNQVTHILNRCDEILEAANRAKREAKLQNKLNKNDKPKKMKAKKKKFEESSDSNEENIKQKFKESEIAKALKYREIAIKKKNNQENLGTSTNSRLLPVEILNAIGDELIIKKPKSKDSQFQRSKHSSQSSDLSDVENTAKLCKKFKHNSGTTDTKIISTSQLSKHNSKILSNPSGIFIEEPLTPKKKKKNISKQEIPSGTIYDEPITPDSKKNMNGFKVCPITPKAIGFKVRNILSAGQKEPPLLSFEKNIRKGKRINISEPIKSLPKPQWTRSGEFVEEKLEGNAKKIRLDESIATDFYVMPLEINKSSKCINSNALEFKKNAMMNSKVRRETSKEMLQRKVRQNIYNKF